MSKGLESLTDLRNDWCGTTDQKERAYNIIEKELQALEIIKNKIAFDEGWEIFLTEEEKETLKEVGL